MLKVCRLLASGEVEWRQFGSAEEAHARVAKWWGESGTRAAAVILPNGKDDARYERPDFDEAKAPDKWPRRIRNPAAERPAPEAPRALPVDLPAVPMFDDGRPAGPSREAAPAAGPGACVVCFQGAAVPVPPEGRDRSPSGRFAAHRCPACGRLWPPGAGNYLAAVRRYVVQASVVPPRVVDTGRVAHAKARGFPK